MPYQNEHAARIHDPSGYTSFARKQIASGIDAIFGVKNGKSEIQAYRFNRKVYTAAQAKAWLKAHKITYIAFEPATGGMNESIRSRAR